MPGSSTAWMIAAIGAALIGLGSEAAHAQDSLSGPLSGSIGTSIYSESTQTGPSSSLVEGDTNLTNSYLRTGTSDPLSYLIESGFMSPYAPEGALISSYADAAVGDQIVNDSTIAERQSDYRNNHDLMSGAGGANALASRSGAAGSVVSGRSGARAAGAASGAFAGLTTRAPFAAGSSVLAAGQAGAMGMNSFVDPNAFLVAAAASPGIADLQAGAAAGSDTASSMGTDSTGTASASGTEMTMLPYGATGMLVPPPTSTAIGPAPGDVFPDTSLALPAASGFPDSTMGTAGLSVSASITPFSRPLLTLDSTERGDPFASMSAETTSFLNPSLIAGGGGAASSLGVTGSEPSTAGYLRELTRKARLHAMIYNGGALPSAFEQRALIRNFERNKGRTVHRRSSLTAPSVTP